MQVDHRSDDPQGLPSPASSPSLTPKDPGSPKSRKRQRSQSMETNREPSSSSLKRSISVDANANDSFNPIPHSNHLSTLSISDSNDEIDSYMAEQNATETPESTTTGPIPGTKLPIDGSKKLSLENLNKGPMQPGETWYLVSTHWYKRWKKACSGEVDKGGPLEEKDLGPVDNSSIIDENGGLNPLAVQGVDFEFVNASIWPLFESWYGECKQPLARTVITRGIMQETVLELYPPRFKALVLDAHVRSICGPAAPCVYVSEQASVRQLCAELAKAARPLRIPAGTPYRVWRLKECPPSEGSLHPPEDLAKHADLIPESEIPFSESLIDAEDAFVVEFKQDAQWVIKDEDIEPPPAGTPPPLFGDSDDFFANLLNPTSKAKAPAVNSPAGTSSSFKSAAVMPFGSGATRSKPAPEPGTLGLGNMGNTCFMNSALQCLVHTQELSEYFLLGVYKGELNPDNPLGMNGAIAESFGALLQRIWASNSALTSYTPREFKQQLQRFAPQFSGYQQHDSQELVAFLLDGLHEDLNRVLKKPYVEKPDWEGGGERELVDLARRSWEGYMKRNDSVIVDLFQGQYQSTLVCPECQKVSITFDPFMYLTLPLPVHKKWRHVVYYVPWDVSKPHQKVYVEIARDAMFKDLRNLLARWMGTKSERLLTLEIFSHSFYKNLDDTSACADVLDNDVVVCFELPCNSQQGRAYKRQPDDPFILPLFLSEVPSNQRFTYGRSIPLFGYPSIVVIDKQQATDLSAMHEAVVERLQRWTANAKNLYTWEVAASSTSAAVDEVPIQITGPPPKDSITEIKENGDVVTVEEPMPEEGDIADEKAIIVQEEGGPASMDCTADGHDTQPRKLHAKKGIFALRLQSGHKEFGTTSNGYGPSISRFERWDERLALADSKPMLLRLGDAFVCEFDENMKAFFFGDDRSRWEHARWDTWEDFYHPEYQEAKMAANALKTQGISLQDCLAEFTKEEQLGEDDLWYCPRCKKHQQATKKFDLWKAPDILVVHLKRFSNSRMLRDKIDTFVDFPLYNLDLTELVEERKVAQNLLAEGLDIAELGLSQPDEDLVYDLYAVDEHIGGLGGGHYRAFALNHLDGKWYHFDDSFVTEARPTDAVNSNAYLLFYRRRTERPLGGKTHTKIESARLHPPSPEPIAADAQLPTPPNEPSSSYTGMGGSRLSAFSKLTQYIPPRIEEWVPGLIALASSSTPPSDSNFDRIQLDNAFVGYDDPLPRPYDYSDSYFKASPTSSNEAQVDPEDSLEPHDAWRSMSGMETPDTSDWQAGEGRSPGSSDSEVQPPADADRVTPEHREDDETGRTDIPIENPN